MSDAGATSLGKALQGNGSVTELRATQERVKVFSQDPLAILSKYPPQDRDFVVVKARLAPSYAFHIYHSDKKAATYFHPMLSSKGFIWPGC